MTEPLQTLTFVGWARERAAALAGTTTTGGRARVTVGVTVAGTAADGSASGSATRQVPFLLTGPPDIIGLRRGAVVRRYPAPGTPDHESDRCPYVELAQPTLPWRYTPAANPVAGAGTLHPWLVLLVGVEGTELTLTDQGGDTNKVVTIDRSIQGGAHAIGNPTTAYRFAHVQVDAAGHRTARILCGRKLSAGTEYLVVLVPAFDDAGRRRWTGQATVDVPVYDHWRFTTATPPGSFEDLAAKLNPGAAASLGRAVLRYPRLGDTILPLEIRGALTATPPPAEQPLPEPVANDLATMLATPGRDEVGRPFVTLPRYGTAWPTPAAPPVWAATLNGDPRHRGVAGLGLEVGIRLQEQYVTDAIANLGALTEARQRLRHAVFGAEISRGLWRRRVPSNTRERLWFLGPALSRLGTTAGTVDHLATATNRTLPAGIFSAAARRTLRPGPARTTLLETPAAAVADAVLNAANKQPPAPPRTIDGVPLAAVGETEFDRARRQVAQAGRVNQTVLLAAARDLAERAHPRLRTIAGKLVTGLGGGLNQNRPVPWGAALGLLTAADADTVGGFRDPDVQAQRLGKALTRLDDRFDDFRDDADLAEFIVDLNPSEARDPRLEEVNLNVLGRGVADAFDPTVAVPPVLRRVLDCIGGFDPDHPTTPPEPCVGLDRATFADLQQVAPEWLLPGAADIAENAVVGLETNPVFVDAFLAGLNTQLLAELRWRNIPVATGCTPLRRFWDRFNTTAGDRADDIIGVGSWTPGSDLGDQTHRPPGSRRDFVVAIRGPLFLRYPATVVYLQSAVRNGQVDFDDDPPLNAPRILPGFQGRLGADIVFFGFPGFDPARMMNHWLVLEEPPAGYRFANDSGTTATTAHQWAADALVSPVRVLIRGTRFVVHFGDRDRG